MWHSDPSRGSAHHFVIISIKISLISIEYLLLLFSSFNIYNHYYVFSFLSARKRNFINKKGGRSPEKGQGTAN